VESAEEEGFDILRLLVEVPSKEALIIRLNQYVTFFVLIEQLPPGDGVAVGLNVSSMFLHLFQ
jgi:hypothetical protein